MAADELGDVLLHEMRHVMAVRAVTYTHTRSHTHVSIGRGGNAHNPLSIDLTVCLSVWLTVKHAIQSPIPHPDAQTDRQTDTARPGKDMSFPSIPHLSCLSVCLSVCVKRTQPTCR